MVAQLKMVRCAVVALLVALLCGCVGGDLPPGGPAPAHGSTIAQAERGRGSEPPERTDEELPREKELTPMEKLREEATASFEELEQRID